MNAKRIPAGIHEVNPDFHSDPVLKRPSTNPEVRVLKGSEGYLLAPRQK